MSVASSNPFSLLPDNAADTDVNVAAVKKQQQQKKPAARAAPAPAPVSAAPERAPRRENAHRGGARRGAEGGERTTRRQGPRRTFDRHSGTGLVDSEKKSKQGWTGDNRAVVEDGEKAAAEARRDGAEDGKGESAAVFEEEEVIVTLDDYLRGRTNEVDTKRELRKANDGGVDKKQLAQGVQLERNEEMFFAPTVGPKTRKQKERKEKTFVDIEQRFVEEQRAGAFRGGRGGRGGARGGRGGARSGPSAPRQARVNVNDESAFPAL